MKSSFFLTIISLVGAALSVPALGLGLGVVVSAAVHVVIPATVTSGSQIKSIVAGLEENATNVAEVVPVLVAIVGAIVPSPAPTSISDALSSIASVYAAHPTDLLVSGLDLVLNSLAPKGLVEDALSQRFDPENSSNSSNTANPSPPIYPTKKPNDVPYSIPENTLRGAMYIPSEFTYGKVPPVIFIPGTASTGGANFLPNFGKLFRGTNYADPVYLNVPGAQLNDIQLNTEYVAYAINYISAVSGHKNVSLVTWSQGSVDCQWAMTYWPSTRSVVSNVINISGDLHGSVLVSEICIGYPIVPCAPALVQQDYNATFIRTLRNAGGSSAYVPTTSIYSTFDEVVQPQQHTGASAYVLDERHVGVTNVELQDVCTVARAGGTIYTHEGVLYNPLAFALAKDALINGGPGQLSRINVGEECQKIVPDGLSLADVLATEATIPVAVVNIETYPHKVFKEPPIMPYAQKDIPA